MSGGRGNPCTGSAASDSAPCRRSRPGGGAVEEGKVRERLRARTKRGSFEGVKRPRAAASMAAVLGKQQEAPPPKKIVAPTVSQINAEFVTQVRRLPWNCWRGSR